jgi:hypothetical protein
MQSDTDTKKYSWSFKDGKMTCCTSETSTCNVSKLWEVTGLTQFHDAELRQATKQIKALLDGVKRSNRDSSRDLHFVQIEGRHLLVWAHDELVGPHDDDQTISKMLRLKDEARPRRTTSRRRQAKAGGAA